jgi:hypothetical protein
MQGTRLSSENNELEPIRTHILESILICKKNKYDLLSSLYWKRVKSIETLGLDGLQYGKQS